MKIKQLKIINQDESTEIADIGVNVENVDIGDSNLANYINENNDNISNLEDITLSLNNQVRSLANGSPLVASSVAEMTDTNKTYVNLVDGYWYYYNGTIWTKGGIYQSIAIEDNAVKYINLDNTLQANLESNSNTTTFLPIKDKIINKDGVEEISINYGYYECNVLPFETYKIHIHYNLNDFGTSRVRTMFKNNDTVVSYTTGVTISEQTNNYYDEIITIPSNVNKLILNCGNVEQYSLNYINKITNYICKNISKNSLDNTMQTFFKDVYEIVSPTLFINHAYMQDSVSIISYSSTDIMSLNVLPGEKYRMTIKQTYANPVIFFSNNNYKFNITFNGKDYEINSCGSRIKNNTSSYQYTDYEFIIPEYCNKIYINKWTSSDSNFKIEKVTSYKVNVDNIDLPNPLDNKTLLFTGDSICAATTEGYKGWVTLMSENNPNTNFYNYGHDGWTIAKAEDEWSNRSIQNVLETMLNEHPEADYIVFEGGVNDYYGSSHGITLGEISSGYNPNNFDRTTFSGGMEYIINYLYTNFPGKKIAYIVTHQCYISGLYQFMDRAKEICKKWSVPIIDLWSEGNLNFNIGYMRNNYSKIDSSHPSGDGLHPNLAGYQIITPKIENALKYKI